MSTREAPRQRAAPRTRETPPASAFGTRRTTPRDEQRVGDVVLYDITAQTATSLSAMLVKAAAAWPATTADELS
ncbi:hypothetical protein [Microbacterium sp.]|uniref:hypothetical protein n=1 Tax=Microbacterium sp. TaxID=51671 RepID=UPI003C723DF7